MTTDVGKWGSTRVTSTAAIEGRRSDEQGSATVVMLGVVATVLVLTISGLLLASAVLASHRARAASDLASLAAAGALMRGERAGDACQSAARVVAANLGLMRSCETSGAEVRLSVSVRSGIAGVGVATARSRAGPDPGGG